MFVRGKSAGTSGSPGQKREVGRSTNEKAKKEDWRRGNHEKIVVLYRGGRSWGGGSQHSLWTYASRQMKSLGERQNTMTCRGRKCNVEGRGERLEIRGQRRRRKTIGALGDRRTLNCDRERGRGSDAGVKEKQGNSAGKSKLTRNSTPINQELGMDHEHVQ